MPRPAPSAVLQRLRAEHEALITRPNRVDRNRSNGLFERYENPILTAAHTPLDWRYDFDPTTNPYMMERMGINGVFNAGAMAWNGKIVLVCRVEADRKSFFAVAESTSGVDGFRFWIVPW